MFFLSFDAYFSVTCNLGKYPTIESTEDVHTLYVNFKSSHVTKTSASSNKTATYIDNEYIKGIWKFHYI